MLAWSQSWHYHCWQNQRHKKAVHMWHPWMNEWIKWLILFTTQIMCINVNQNKCYIIISKLNFWKPDKNQKHAQIRNFKVRWQHRMLPMSYFCQAKNKGNENNMSSFRFVSRNDMIWHWSIYAALGYYRTVRSQVRVRTRNESANHTVHPFNLDELATVLFEGKKVKVVWEWHVSSPHIFNQPSLLRRLR